MRRLNIYSKQIMADVWYAERDTVYALTFAVVVDQQPFAKVSSHENFDQSGNDSTFVRQLHHKNA